MKKALSLILALVMCLSLCACGVMNNNHSGTNEETMSKEDLLAAAQTLNVYQCKKDYQDNIMRAKENYVGKVYRLSGVVSEIEDGYCQIRYSSSTQNYLYIDAYFDNETLMNLTRGKGITFVGEVSELVEASSSTGKFIMKNAYQISDKNVLQAKIVEHSSTSACVELLDSEFAGLYACMYYLETNELATGYTTGNVVYIEGVLEWTAVTSYCGKSVKYEISAPKIVNK